MAECEMILYEYEGIQMSNILGLKTDSFDKIRLQVLLLKIPLLLLLRTVNILRRLEFRSLSGEVKLGSNVSALTSLFIKYDIKIEVKTKNQEF